MASNIIDELLVKIGFKTDDKGLKKTKKEIDGFLQGVKTCLKSLAQFGAIASAAVFGLYKLEMAVARSNYAFINFARQTDISLAKLNRFAGAASLADFGLDATKAMGGLAALESNLAAISIGQGNIAPFQILGIDPTGKDATQIIDELRTAIKGVSSPMAANLIQQMGLSPEFLAVLRMSRGEFAALGAEAEKFTLSVPERGEMNEFSLRLKLLGMRFTYLRDKVLLKVAPVIEGILNLILNLSDGFAELIKWMVPTEGAFKALIVVATALAAAIAPIPTALVALLLVLEDIYAYAHGKESLFGHLTEGLELFFTEAKSKVVVFFAEVVDRIKNAIKWWNRFIHQDVPNWVNGLFNWTPWGKKNDNNYATNDSIISNLNAVPRAGQMNANTTINQNNYIDMANASDMERAQNLVDLAFTGAQLYPGAGAYAYGGT